MILLLLAACNGDGSIFGGNGNGNGNGNGTTVTVPSRDPDETIEADLSQGATVDLAWASSAYCWPATENPNFNGAHVWIDRPIGWDRELVLRASPESGVDVSLYYVERTGTAVPPNLDSNNTFDCDASYDAQGDSNPGRAELLLAPAPVVSDMNLLIGVAGANGAVSGAYTLEIWDEQAEVPDDSQ